MNKTVNINLGGMFFHIDEDAYQKLTRYFDAIKRSLSNSNGQDEIIKDIEMRIAEIVSERQSPDKQVISLRQVEEVIAIMGQPEDYRLEDEGPAEKTSYDYSRRPIKKLYRDLDKATIGGVATGLGHYFGIDAFWIKIILVILTVVSFGTGIIVYIVLWVVMPGAVTTSEKLEMTGEPVTISNIEKKVREEFEAVTEKFKNVDYDKMGNQVKTGADRVANNFLEVLSKIFKVFAKILGAVITIFSAFMLVAMLVALFTLGSSSLVEVPWQSYLDAINYTDFPIWVIALLSFFAFGIPTFFLFILGLKLLITNMKSIGSIAKYTLLALWIISIAMLITFGIKQATEIASDGRALEKQTLNLKPNDTLKVKFTFSDFYAKDLNDNNDYEFVQDESGKEVIHSNEVHLEVLATDAKQPYVQIEKRANGKSLSAARKRAEEIVYTYKWDGNTLELSNFYTTDVANKYRNQEVVVYLYLPPGYYFKPDSNIQNFDYSDDWFFNLHHSGDYLYFVEKNKVRCLDCPNDENEFEDLLPGSSEEQTETSIDSSGTTVTINSHGVQVHSDRSQTGRKRFKTLKLDENGVIIKTE